MTVHEVLAVVTVYGRPWSEVRSSDVLGAWLESAASAHERAPAFQLRRLHVHDNSPSAVGRPPTHSGSSYVHDVRNGGTRAAYAGALEAAEAEGIGWVLLLDQDTELPANYLAAAAAAWRAEHAVLVPTIVSHGRVVSPGRISPWGGIAADRGDTDDRPLAPIASGCLILTDSLALLRRLHPALWLDYVDHCLFLRLQRAGARIGRIDVQLEHDLSVGRLRTVSEERLRSIWSAERLFADELGGAAARVLPLRVALRALRVALAAPAKAWRAWRGARAPRSAAA
jgi:hypothetical protein